MSIPPGPEHSFLRQIDRPDPNSLHVSLPEVLTLGSIQNVRHPAPPVD
ncbi:MAG: hypothetical protein QF405_10250 [Roseibacillus sp.]|nr:hypothetical protein [Roseibacillus sp.]MDP6208836.1 hypothetical protein [Roseibacillus sp.]MDP7308009.1 hypothetical protein [Roseibacillus sp.]MDP7657374.1 hypothetical protein [Roseibacillus sp.]HJM65643.1 hypothetical protein [Roseibacillus sp.]